MSTEPIGEIRYVVTLVHGTFARNAAWTLPESYFCRTLCDQVFPRRGIIITQFLWSGWNSPWSRKKAARELRAQLERQITCYPDARHYVIGHSHGGAVALQAVHEESGLSDRISGVATLATPFIHTRKRAIAPFDYRGMLRWLCFVPLAGFTAYGGFKLWIRFSDLGGASILAFVAGLIAAAYVLLTLAGKVGSWLLHLGEDASKSLQCCAPDGSNLLIVRTSGDEASAALASSQLLSWAVGRVWQLVGILLRPFFRLLRVSERVSPIVPALLIILCFGLLLFLEFSSAMDAISEFTPVYPNDSVIVTILRQLARPFTAGYRQVPDMGLTLLFAAVIVVGGSFTALTCFVVPAILLLSIILLPFGAESALAGLLVEISVETVPAGVWRVHQFGPTDDEGQGLNLLHSSSYEDRRVLSLIARWIMQGGQTGAANKTSEHEQPHLTDPVL